MPSKRRAIAPGFLDNDIFRLQTLQHVMRMTRTWDSTMSMIPKGGDTIWGGLGWSPEEGYTPAKRKERNNDTHIAHEDGSEVVASQRNHVNYGRIISFGKDVAEAPASEIDRIDFRVSLSVRLYFRKTSNFMIVSGILFSSRFIFNSAMADEAHLRANSTSLLF